MAGEVAKWKRLRLMEGVSVPQFIHSAQDLVTSREATRDGFLSQAFHKTQIASPYIIQARQLRDELQQSADPQSVVNNPGIYNELVASAGFSDKAVDYISEHELREAVLEVLEAIHEQAQTDWREEILYRFLLTKGDSLGGTMRNTTGASAQVKFVEAILDALHLNGLSPSIQQAPIKQKVQTIGWPSRLLLFDKKPPLIGNSVDVILLKRLPAASVSMLLGQPTNYIACGELKGGIDPAGADEHWKTASSALERIRRKFPENTPKLFFAGAAIEQAMATEVFSQLRSGLLAHAANLNVPHQLSDLATWLVGL
jgi:hypothetical protein